MLDFWGLTHASSGDFFFQWIFFVESNLKQQHQTRIARLRVNSSKDSINGRNSCSHCCRSAGVPKFGTGVWMKLVWFFVTLYPQTLEVTNNLWKGHFFTIPKRSRLESPGCCTCFFCNLWLDLMWLCFLCCLGCAQWWANEQWMIIFHTKWRAKDRNKVSVVRSNQFVLFQMFIKRKQHIANLQCSLRTFDLLSLVGF